MNAYEGTNPETQLREARVALERSFDVTLEALVNAMRLKHPETAGHLKRVAGFAISIARVMGLGPDKIRPIARGALLHDIGKLGVPDHILGKPVPLDSEEMAMMRSHCVKGHDLVKGIPFLAETAETIYSHHEKYDGSGYPRGLRGEQIPLGARIVALANALDVMMSPQPYRAAQPFSAAMDELQRCAGTQFDGEIVKALLKLPENAWLDLSRQLS